MRRAHKKVHVQTATNSQRIIKADLPSIQTVDSPKVRKRVASISADPTPAEHKMFRQLTSSGKKKKNHRGSFPPHNVSLFWTFYSLSSQILQSSWLFFCFFFFSKSWMYTHIHFLYFLLLLSFTTFYLLLVHLFILKACILWECDNRVKFLICVHSLGLWKMIPADVTESGV